MYVQIECEISGMHRAWSGGGGPDGLEAGSTHSLSLCELGHH